MVNNSIYEIQRSRLIMPAHNKKFVNKAYARNADCIVLDLEDSVPLNLKDNARSDLKNSIKLAKSGGGQVAVRVNNEKGLLLDDLESAVEEGLNSIYLPKVENYEQILEIEEIIEKLEIQKELKHGSVKIDVLIETASGVYNVDKILSSSSRINLVSFGAEDFSMETGIDLSNDTTQAMLIPRMDIILAAKRNNVMPSGLIGSISNYKDLETLEKNCIISYKHGYSGGSCIHPSNVEILNKYFSPNNNQINEAKEIVKNFENALESGKAAISYNDRMIDYPHYKQALSIIKKNTAILELENKKEKARKIAEEENSYE